MSELLDNPIENSIEFPRNQTLAEICGPFDQNLSLIERELEITIARRGNTLLLSGDAPDVRRAKHVIAQLEEMVGKDIAIEQGAVKAAIRFSTETRTTQASLQGIDLPVSIQTPKKLIVPRTKRQATFVEGLFQNELSFGIGPAGTGKTYLAVAAAVSYFTRGEVDKIILSRPAIEAGERIGFLPGDMKEKVDPYMQPLYDALDDFLPSRQLARMYEDKKIEIAPLAFMRGRTLSRAFVVLDEAQNATKAQMKMFLTRLGEDARMAITGDMSQIDLPSHTGSGLVDAVKRLRGIDGIGFHEFTAQDVVRHPLVAKIIHAYDEDVEAR